MHRSRFYRNPNSPRFSYFNSVSQAARNTYRRSSVTPFTPSYNRDPNLIGKHFASNPRFADRSKYVWTANKQQPQQALPTQVQQQVQAPKPQTVVKPPVVAKPPTVVKPPAVTKPSVVVKPQTVIRSPNKLVLSRKNDGPAAPGELKPLSVTVLDSAENVAKDIAQKLNEQKVYLIKKVVDGIGVKKAIKLYQETQQKEARGGILVQNGIRRRTPGGVFLTLLRESSFISIQEANRVFLEIKRYESKVKLTSSHDIS